MSATTRCIDVGLDGGVDRDGADPGHSDSLIGATWKSESG
jgi:hypothetical protein